jgi:hypothetical protein
MPSERRTFGFQNGCTCDDCAGIQTWLRQVVGREIFSRFSHRGDIEVREDVLTYETQPPMVSHLQLRDRTSGDIFEWYSSPGARVEPYSGGQYGLSLYPSRAQLPSGLYASGAEAVAHALGTPPRRVRRSRAPWRANVDVAMPLPE